MSEEAVLKAMAVALYETDEALLDEAIAARIAIGDRSWTANSHPSIAFGEIAPELRRAYMRRARAARAAEQYTQSVNAADPTLPLRELRRPRG